MEVAIATAEKDKAIGVATAEKTFQLALLERVQEDIGYNHYWYGGYWYGGYWGGPFFLYNYWWYDDEIWDDRRLAAALATTVTTPWSVQYAAAQAAYETRTASTANAQYDKRVDQSIAQGAVELAVASEEAELQIEYANLQYALDMAYALGTYAAAAARGMSLLAGKY